MGGVELDTVPGGQLADGLEEAEDMADVAIGTPAGEVNSIGLELRSREALEQMQGAGAVGGHHGGELDEYLGQTHVVPVGMSSEHGR